MADNEGWGRRPGGSGDEPREFRAGQPDPAPQPAPQPQQPDWGQTAPQADYQGAPQYAAPYAEPYTEQDRKRSGAGTFLLVAVPVLIIVLVAALLVWKWDDLFGGGSDNTAGGGATLTSQAPGAPEESEGAEESEGSEGPSDTESSEAAETSSAARPDRAELPAGAEPVNAAARNNEPTGDFNSVYKSPPTGATYTSDEFAQAVRDAFVEAYLDNRDTEQVLDVVSPANQQSYRMSCTDEGSYVHCSGGNDANVYIA